ncbi:MAG: universal stress protein [Candidatus Neomarinimicrobiota bacterium]
MYEKILIPLDSSHIGEAALSHVAELVAKLSPKTKVEVTLLQVISSLTHYVIAGEASVQVPYNSQEIAQIQRRARSYLNKAGDSLKSAGATVKTKVTNGNAAEEIMRVADQIQADMVAMSTHGRHGLSRWAFGSVTDKVLRAGKVPVLVVRAPKGTENI